MALRTLSSLKEGGRKRGTITDNPPRDGYRGLGYFGVGYPPDEDDLEAIRTLFEEAGIPAENYQALR